MPNQWAALGMNAANAATGGIIGQGIGMINDQRQIRVQRQLMADQEAANKRMYDYGQAGSYEMWKKTGPVGMMEQLQKAGLNPALMYGTGGSGGTTGGGSAGSVTGGTAPAGGGEIQAGMAMMLQNQLVKAQKENIEADTANKEADTAKKSGVDTEKVKSEIADITQGIENKKVQAELTKVQTQIAGIEERIKASTEGEQTERIVWESRKVLEELDQINRNNFIQKATMNNVIDTVKAELMGVYLRNAMTKAQTQATYTGIKKTETETTDIIRQGVQRWKALSLQERSTSTGERQQANDEFINDMQKSLGLPVEIIREAVDGIFRRR